jgi:hypothetical protein
MKSRFVHRTCITLCLFHYISIPLDSALAERKAIPIGISNSPRATAFNNARKIVRTSDDIRLVVYQDSLDTKSAVMWTWSADGFIWSRPEVLGVGEFPALAIDADDRIYAAWSNPDSLQIYFASFQRVSPSSRKFKLTGTYNENVGMRGRHVSLDASASGLHLVVEYGAWISYAHYSKDTFTPYYFYNNDNGQTRTPGTRSRFPSITGDLEFAPGTLHILWTDSLDNPDSTRIGYWRAPEVPIQEMNFYDDYFKVLNIAYPEDWVGKSFPSISVRDRGYGSFFVMAYSDMINNLLTTTSVYSYEDDPCTLSNRKSTVSVTGNPMPGSDDTLPFAVSCAIVWQNAGEIYYGQAEDERIITDPPVLVSEPNGSLKQFPSVCYKTFRADSFDVVWTEGTHPPYQVMYRRMAKCYMANKVKMITEKLADAVVGLMYVEYMQVTGGSGHPYEFNVISGTLPKHFGFDNYIFCGLPCPDSSGVFRFTIRVTDFLKTSSDTAEFTLMVRENKFEFISPDSVVAEENRAFSYIAQATDPFGKNAHCSFGNLPSWLTVSDSIISGVVPMNSADTCFLVIASYKVLNDTMEVRVHLTEWNGIDTERRLSKPPKTYALFPNYPNPFNPSTTILFAVPEAGHVSIDLLDLRGNPVKSLLDRRLSAGHHSVVLNGSDIPSGVYLIRMGAGRFSAIRKCILLK